MPKFITSIRLQEASEKDYAILSSELKKYFFNPVTNHRLIKSNESSPAFMFNSTRHKSLLDSTTAVSHAAALTGKKYSFTVIREKTKLES